MVDKNGMDLSDNEKLTNMIVKFQHDAQCMVQSSSNRKYLFKSLGPLIGGKPFESCCHDQAMMCFILQGKGRKKVDNLLDVINLYNLGVE